MLNPPTRCCPVWLAARVILQGAIMRFESAIVLALKSLLCLGCLWLAGLQVLAVGRLGCDGERYPPSVLYAVFAAIPVLAFYLWSSLMRKGLILHVVAVRALFAAAVAIQLAQVALAVALTPQCESLLSIVLVPAGLALFYVMAALALLFGDAYLGVLRGVIRSLAVRFDTAPAVPAAPVPRRRVKRKRGRSRRG